MPGTKPKRSRPKDPDPGVSGSEVFATAVPTPDEIRARLWALASDPEKPATAQVKALELLLTDARHERGDDGEVRHADDLNKRAIALMRSRVAN